RLTAHRAGPNARHVPQLPRWRPRGSDRRAWYASNGTRTPGPIPRRGYAGRGRRRRGAPAQARGDAMKVGTFLPQHEIGADLAGLRDYAQAVQDLGYAFLATADHVVGADPAGHPGMAVYRGQPLHADGRRAPQLYPIERLVHEPFAFFGF